jgi:hypothetical protein
MDVPVTNVKSKWSSGNLVFTSDVANSLIQFGQTNYPLQCKFHNRPAVTGSTVEVRAKPLSATSEHAAVDSTLDWAPVSTVSGGYARALQGVCRLDTGKTMTSGSLCGTYGQVANNGTINGSGVMLSAIYGLVEAGGVFTSLSHLAVAWLDSHLAQAISSGTSDFLYISNNGSTTFDNAIYCYAGNKITNFFNINTASGMVSGNTAGGGTLNFTNWRTIKVVLEGTTHYLVAAQTIA